MHDSTSETREVQLLEHQGYRGMRVLFLESHDDWSISRIRMAPRRKLQTREWLVRRTVDQHVIGWRSAAAPVCCFMSGKSHGKKSGSLDSCRKRAWIEKQDCLQAEDKCRK